MKITVYTNIPSFYQENFFMALQKKCELLVCYEKELPNDRIKLGWQCSLSGYNYRFEQQMRFMEKIRLKRDSHHLVSGSPGGFKNYLRSLLFSGDSILLYQSEFPAPGTVSNFWELGSRIFSSTVNKKRIALLGIGERIRNYWLSIGVDKELIFPWGYFVSSSVESKEITHKAINLPIVFVGQLIKRKGIDILLKAYNSIKKEISNDLIIIGDGEERDNIIHLINELDIAGRVKLLGAINSYKIQKKISDCSVLVLPSRYDGWGVVVNEAIINEVPVIVSSQCGSKELIERLDVGYVFESENVDDLANKLKRILTNPVEMQRIKKHCMNSKNKISPEKASLYLINIIDYMISSKHSKLAKRPLPPWYLK